MPEFVERQAAVKIAEKYGLTDGSVLGQHSGLADCIASEIESLPAADVAFVVRCKNCAFSQLDGWFCGGTALMPQHQTFPDSFCECGAKMYGGVE